MLKHIAFTFALFSLSLPAVYAAENANSNGDLNWSEASMWTMDCTPKSFAQSLDNKRTFVLGTDSKIYIYQTEDGKLLGVMPVSEHVIDISIAPRGETIYLVEDDNKTFTALDISFRQQIDIGNSPVLGNPEAPLTLVVFSDFECPYCSKVEPLLHKLADDNKDTLKIVFKNLPLMRIHKRAEATALASLAAQNQGKFWEMHDRFFQTRKLSDEDIVKAAEELGLNMEQFNKDWKSEETKQRLGEDIMAAEKAQVSGTPSLFLNGMPVKTRSAKDVQKMIDQALQDSQS